MFIMVSYCALDQFDNLFEHFPLVYGRSFQRTIEKVFVDLLLDVGL